ncbi:hypothetical protein, partial [Kocuria salsicia]|uniref:hypothetical protein n=1 Tax=Kocuria salsicia TaxID=664639 RepID=UPI001643C2EA
MRLDEELGGFVDGDVGVVGEEVGEVRVGAGEGGGAGVGVVVVEEGRCGVDVWVEGRVVEGRGEGLKEIGVERERGGLCKATVKG